MNNRQIKEEIGLAVKYFWQSRAHAAKKQKRKGVSDTGRRSEVTGGQNMNGFVQLVEKLVKDAGLKNTQVLVCEHTKTLPGFFRPTKDWDVVVTRGGKLLAALEFKSQAGSFGNNFNNRVEEAVGSAEDFWLAYRAGLFGSVSKPFLGYCFLMEDCEESRREVKPKPSLFPVSLDSVRANRQGLLELFCRKLVRERKYDAAAAIFSAKGEGRHGGFHEVAEDVSAVALFVELQAKLTANGRVK